MLFSFIVYVYPFLRYLLDSLLFFSSLERQIVTNSRKKAKLRCSLLKIPPGRYCSGQNERKLNCRQFRRKQTVFTPNSIFRGTTISCLGQQFSTVWTTWRVSKNSIKTTYFSQFVDDFKEITGYQPLKCFSSFRFKLLLCTSKLRFMIHPVSCYCYTILFYLLLLFSAEIRTCFLDYLPSPPFKWDYNYRGIIFNPGKTKFQVCKISKSGTVHQGLLHFRSENNFWM